MAGRIRKIENFKAVSDKTGRHAASLRVESKYPGKAAKAPGAT